MANLMITTACNLRCPYCFGLDMIGPTHPSRNMPWDTFISLLDWIESGERRPPDMHLMGGEPTLHPRFADMALELRRRGWETVVFSNAAAELPDGCLEELVELGVQWVVNVNHPPYYGNPKGPETLKRNLAKLGRAAVLTVNIFPDEADYNFFWDYFDSYNLSPNLKLGVALPTMNKKNSYMAKEQLAKAGAIIMDILDKAELRGIQLGFECGVPLCVLNKKQKARLRDVYVSHCGSRLDITPDGQVIYCLPLSKLISPSYRSFSSWAQATEWYKNALAKYRPLGVYDSCMSCEHRTDGFCSACLANSIDAFNKVILPSLPLEP